MKRHQIGEVTLELITGDITDQPDMDAIVNAANAELETGGGVAGAIHRAAGPRLAEECRPLAPIAAGECVITGAHELPNQKVIHCLGPVYGRDEPSAELLADCYRNALLRADAAGLSSVAFPAISTGAFGYPATDAAEVALTTVTTVARQLQSVRVIRFVLFSDRDRDIHEQALSGVV